MSWAAGKLGWVSPEDRAPASASPQPRKPPRASPPTVPNAATSTDSSRTMDRSWARVWPTARSRPISRVRSNTDSIRVLTMPMSAMMMASASSAYTRPSSVLMLAAWDCSNWARVCTCTLG